MGTRHFSSVEGKDSRIKWEKADPDMAKKITAAIKNDVGRIKLGIGSAAVFVPVVILVGLMTAFFFMTRETPAPLFFSVPFVSGGCALFVIALWRCIKLLPYFYPEKQTDVWAFQAKCGEVCSSGIGSDERYYATFQKGGGHISLDLGWCNEPELVGKEFIFYKFNERCGNRWAAVRAELVEAGGR